MSQFKVSYDELLPRVRKAMPGREEFRRAILLAFVMRWFAIFRGHNEDADAWAAYGLLRRSSDVISPESVLVGENDALIKAVRAGSVADADAQSPLTEIDELACLLVTLDNLTALISAIAVTRPKGSVRGLKVSAVQKKFRDRAFAPDCARLAVMQGARRMRWEIGDLTSKTIKSILETEAEVDAAIEQAELRSA